MRDLNDKNTGNSLTADEWNDSPSELQNIIENTGQTLSAADLNQLGKGVAQYVANSDFYTDSGVADAYVLTVVGGKQSPVAYEDGMKLRFRPANTNTGASTANPAGLGVKNIFKDGAAVAAGDLPAGISIGLEYDLGNDRLNVTATEGVLGEFPSGTLMLFQQTAAPTGWTKEVTHDNKALRVVTGAAGSGGTDNFTTVFGAGKVSGGHALTIAELAAHNHVLFFDQGTGAGSDLTVAGSNGDVATSNTGSTGSGTAHDHTLPIDVQYVDLIIASKD